jgi:hypothetical protein
MAATAAILDLVSVDYLTNAWVDWSNFFWLSATAARVRRGEEVKGKGDGHKLWPCSLGVVWSNQPNKPKMKYKPGGEDGWRVWRHCRYWGCTFGCLLAIWDHTGDVRSGVS